MSCAQVSEDLVQLPFAHSETALAADEFPVKREHLDTGIPCAVNNDRPLACSVIGGVEADQSLGAAMLADMTITGDECPLAGRDRMPVAIERCERSVHQLVIKPTMRRT
jgi:hypothetical protein